MRYGREFIATILTFLMCSTYVFAEETTKTFQMTPDEINISATETELNDTADNSNLSVKIIEQIGDQSTIVYAGLLSEYDNGAWNDVDFAEIDFIVIFNWETDVVIYIVPNNEQNVTNSINAISEASDDGTQENNENILTVTETVSITSQIKLNGVNVGETGLRIIDNANMQCDFSISNTSATSENTTIILATYSSTGALVNVEAFSAEVAANDTENISFVYQFNAETEHSARLMFWNSLSGMMPIKAKVDFSQTSGINAYYYNHDNRLLQIDKANGTSIFYTYDNMGSLLTKIVRK